MKPQTFIQTVLIGAVLVVSGVALMNYTLDPYGLFHSRSSADLSIYADERTSKYLLTHKYVPENFEGVLCGPSLSANMNPGEFPEAKLYNASMMGANITEMSLVLDNASKSGALDYVILCLDPYIVRDSGRKTGMMVPKEKMGALGSTFLLKAYALRAIREQELAPGKYAKGTFNAYGYNNYNLEQGKDDARSTIQYKLESGDLEPISIEQAALDEFGETVEMLRTRGVQVFAYYSPIPYELYKLRQEEYDTFKETMAQFFDPNERVIDLNHENNIAFTSNYDNYIDHGHLSEDGQRLVLDTLLTEINHHQKFLTYEK